MGYCIVVSLSIAGTSPAVGRFFPKIPRRSLLLLLFHLLQERLGGLETWQIVRRNSDRNVFGYIAGCFLGSMLYDKTAETAQVDVFPVQQGVLNHIHKRLHSGGNFTSLDTGILYYTVYYLCFCHCLE